MHELIEQMKAGLEDLEYRVPENAWDQFQVKAERQAKTSKGSSFFFWKLAAVLFLISTISLKLQHETGQIRVQSEQTASQHIALQKQKAADNKSLNGNDQTFFRQPASNRRISPAENQETFKAVAVLRDSPGIMSASLARDDQINKSGKNVINRWILADIISGSRQLKALKVEINGKTHANGWYQYERTNGKQSLIVKSNLEEHPSKYGFNNVYHSAEVRLPQDFAMGQGSSVNLGERNQVISGVSGATVDGEAGSVGSEGVVSPSPVRPVLPPWHPGVSTVGSMENPGRNASDKRLESESSSTKTRNLQNLEYYNLSIGFKQKLKKEKTIKFEPFLRIPITGFQHKEQFNYNQYGIKIGLSF